jgi:hypothetical protein
MATTVEGPKTHSLHFQVEPSGGEVLSLPELAVVAGFTGRDRSEVLAHIEELAAEGVAPPHTIPSYYAVAPQLLIQGDLLVTTERGTSGEAEVGLVVDRERILITLASDHTDRAAERIDIAASKRLCHKVVATSVWPFEDVLGHWDSLRLRSWIGDDGSEPYQDGSLAELVTPGALLEAIPWRRTEPQCFFLLCGTVPTIGGLGESNRFKAELYDPERDIRLVLDYRVEVCDFLVPNPIALTQEGAQQ